MTCRDCERMREALRCIEHSAQAVKGLVRACQKLSGPKADLLMEGPLAEIERIVSVDIGQRAALAPASEPRAVNEDAVERVARAIYSGYWGVWAKDFDRESAELRGSCVRAARAAIAALGDPAADVRAVLREVLDAIVRHGDLEAEVREELPDDLRKRAEEAAR